VKWEVCDESWCSSTTGFGPDGESFIEGNTYKAVVTLTPKPNYTFSDEDREDTWSYYSYDFEKRYLFGADTLCKLGSYNNPSPGDGDYKDPAELYLYVEAISSETEAAYAKIDEAATSLLSLKEELSVSADLVNDAESAHEYLGDLIGKIPGWKEIDPGNAWINYSYINGVDMNRAVWVQQKAISGVSHGHGEFRLGLMINDEDGSWDVKYFNGTFVIKASGVPDDLPAKVSWTVIGGGTARVEASGWDGRDNQVVQTMTGTIEVEPGSTVFFGVRPSNGYTLASWSSNVTNIEGYSPDFRAVVTAGAGGTTKNVTITLASKTEGPYSDSVFLYWGERVQKWIATNEYELMGTIKVRNLGPDGTGNTVLTSGTRVAKTDIVEITTTPASANWILSSLSNVWLNGGNVSDPHIETRKFAEDENISAYFIDLRTWDPLIMTFNPNGGTFTSGLTIEKRVIDRYNNFSMMSYNHRFVTRQDYTLIGWATTKAKADKGEVDVRIGLGDYWRESATIYAVWKENEALVREAGQKITATVSETSKFTTSDLGTTFSSTKPPTLETATSFITSNIVNDIQTTIRGELGTDEVYVTIADGSIDADSELDLNGVSAPSVAPTLSNLITRNGEKGYEYTYYLKVKRNPYVYVGPYVAWIPSTEDIPPPPTAPTAPTITTTSLSSATIGSAYSSSALAATGTPSFTWSVVSGSLPAGLSLNSATGVISGTPTGSAGTVSFTVRAVNAAGEATKQLSIAVNGGQAVTPVTPPVVTPTTPTTPSTPSTPSYTTYTITFNANSGSVSPYIYTDNTGVDGRLTSLPTAMRSGGYVFVGWFTAPDGGAEVTTRTVFNSNREVYAHWMDQTGVASVDREVPGGIVVEEVVVVPVRSVSGVVTVGPSPVRTGGAAAIYWSGSKAVSGRLGVFDATGGLVSVIEVSPSASLGDRGTKKIGTWAVGGVAEGAYLIRGVLTDKDGGRVKVSVLVAVVR
jgi:hypothetical protein